MDDETIRLYLHTLLVSNFPDMSNIYYRPSGNLQITRPCIIYESRSTEPSYANNASYVTGTRFQVTILSDLPGYSNKRKMFTIPGIVIVDNNSYVESDILHDVFTIMVNVIR